jgi:hypothetical protein
MLSKAMAAVEDTVSVSSIWLDFLEGYIRHETKK